MAKSKKTKKENFKPKEWIASHPHSQNVVTSTKKSIIKHIKSKSSGEPKFNEWYVGVARKPKTDRTNSHRSTKKLASLKDFKSFYAYSLSNARKSEEDLCKLFGLKNCKAIGGLRRDSNKVYVYHYKKSPNS